MKNKTRLICIMDGYGLTDRKDGNAIMAAKKPNIDYLMQEYPNIQLHASETEVGLPKGQMGNSEVGHLNIGCGRIVYQALTLISKNIANKKFFKNEILLEACEHANKHNSSLHIMGLLSDGGVHSHIEHIFATIQLAAKQKVKSVYLHLFMDGRDTAPNSGTKYIQELLDFLKDYNNTQILTISGRYYAMDRDKRWERLNKVTDVMLSQKGETFSSPIEYLTNLYEKQIFDEFIVPAYNKNFQAIISENDAIISCNFRPDRMIQLASSLTNPSYDFYPSKIDNLYFVSMMPYDKKTVLGQIAFHTPKIENCMGEWLSKLGKKQLRIAETEKYAHVTFFFDGGEKVQYPNCKQILIPSPKVATYDLQPEMSIAEVNKTLIKELDNNYDLVVLNYANCDMVGHTGVIPATIKAVEAVDKAVGELYQKVQEIGGTMFIFADHGNAEYMLDEAGNKVTSHSLNPVPFIVTDKKVDFKTEIGKLADIIPTIFKHMNIEIPQEMTGKILIK